MSGQWLTIASEAARAGAAELMRHFGRVEEQEKGPRDLVSAADFASQQVIHQRLLEATPDFAFLGEETTSRHGSPDLSLLSGDRPVWVVDPLDGTMNYLHRLPGFCVSIGLVVRGEPVLGVIYDPLLDELFAGANGQAATCNGRRLSVSRCDSLEKALIAASLPSRLRRDSVELQRFIDVSLECRSLRRMGSAALNLAYVAAGRMDAYWATTVNAWDVAGGLALVRLAGGQVTGVFGGPLSLVTADFTAAATPALHRSLVSILRRSSEY